MKVREPLILNDGTRLSVQASAMHYCRPRVDDASEYTSVEVGCYKPLPEFDEWANCVVSRSMGGINTYAGVPVHVVLNFIEAHGGVRSGEFPPMVAIAIVKPRS